MLYQDSILVAISRKWWTTTLLHLHITRQTFDLAASSKVSPLFGLALIFCTLDVPTMVLRTNQPGNCRRLHHAGSVYAGMYDFTIQPSQRPAKTCAPPSTPQSILRLGHKALSWPSARVRLPFILLQQSGGLSIC